MPYRNALLAAVCLIWTCFRLAPAFGDTEFETAQLKAAAINPPGVSVTLNLPVGRTQFHRGEIIPLSAVFASSLPGKYDLDTDDGSRDLQWGSDSFHCDAVTGAVDPLPVYYDHEFGMSYSGPGPRLEPLSAKPRAVSYTVNEWLRFDAPGHYRVYLTSGRVTDAVKRHDGLFFRGHAMASNAVEFDILPDDPVWDAKTLQAALPPYNRDTKDKYLMQNPQTAAARTICFLGTPEAAQAMITRYAASSGYDFLDTRAYFETRLGLFGFPQPSFVISEMERCISDPDFPVSEQFVSDLAQVQFLAAYTQTVPRYVLGDPVREKARQDLSRQRLAASAALEEQDWERLQAAAPAKRGKARVATLYALSRPQLQDTHTPEHQSQVRALVPVFEELTPDQQENLLSYHWAVLREPAMLPILSHLYASGHLGSVLPRLLDLSPVEGQRLLLAEIKSAHSQVDLPTLCSLPDRRLPALNGVLAARLERCLRTQDDDENTPRLVERYATAAILPRVKAAYENKDGQWNSDMQTSLLAYFLRTDPTYGAAQMRKVLAAYKNAPAYCSVLSDVAALYAGPEMERLALRHLHDSNIVVAADAAKMLGENGFPRDEPALWARLREWHTRWAGKEDAISPLDVNSSSVEWELEARLVDALSASPKWLTTPAQLQALDKLCVTTGAHQNVQTCLRAWTPAGPISVGYAGDADTWVVVQYNSLPSFTALESKLIQFPRGTRFRLSPTNFLDAASQRQAFARLKPFLTQRGLFLTLQPFPLPQPK